MVTNEPPAKSSEQPKPNCSSQNDMQLTSSTSTTTTAAVTGSSAQVATAAGSSAGMRQPRPKGSSKQASLPASAVSAAPYVPPSYAVQNDYIYYDAPPPPIGQPPPPGPPGPPGSWVPYFYEGQAAPPAHYVQHMCNVPPPQVDKGLTTQVVSRAVTPVGSGGTTVVTSTPPGGGPVVSGSSEQPQEFVVEYHFHQENIHLQWPDGRVQIIPGKTPNFY